jgi:RNA polymerase sigma factor (sigma-70 family)
MTKETIDVEAINILLIGDKDDIARGIRLIHDSFKGKIVEIIRRTAVSADESELQDIYQDVILGISQAAFDGKYDPDKRTLQAYIYKIATNKAKDYLRRKFAQKRVEDSEQRVTIDSVTKTLEDSSIKEVWQYAQQNEEISLILENIKKIIPRLKKRQRQVAELILVKWPNFLSDAEIKIEILNIYGEDITTLAIKSARQEVYSKVKEALKTNGHGDDINDQP